MTSAKPSTPLSRRTKVITAASIGAVGLASLFAIGANLGILARADDSDVGTMSAAGDVVTPAADVVDIGLGQQMEPLSSTPEVDGAQRFTVDTAGTVDVSVVDSSVHLELASPSDGWTATPTIGDGNALLVVFTNGSRTLEFTAVIGLDGMVAGDLIESTTEAASPVDHHDDDHDSDHHSHDSDHHDDHDHDGTDDDD